jgi:stage II sporulation protein D
MGKWSSTLLAGTLLIGAAVLGCTGGCQPKPLPSRTEIALPHVRVRLLAGVQKVTLLAQTDTAVLDANSGQPVGIDLPAGQPVEATFDGKNWQIGGQGVRGVTLTIAPSVDGAVKINNAAYRGRYVLVPAGANHADVINDVDVESYLQGVLARELLADWHPQAYRAQAIIARTYALYEAKTNPAGKNWDLNPDERSQVYGGMAAETAKANAAVAETRGVVAAFGPAGQERIFKAYFSACCGGISSSASDVFNEPPIAPLSAKSNGTTCSISTRYNWPPVTLSKFELTRRFRAWGAKQGRPEVNLPGVRSIQVASANSFGRPRSFMLTDTRNQQYILTAEQLRWAINTEPNNGPTVFSGFFTPTDTGDAIRFENGHGFGHGVGACQWCMQARALAGESYQQIVLQAFPKSVMVTAY